jgi:hypothetical protein
MKKVERRKTNMKTGKLILIAVLMAVLISTGFVQNAQAAQKEFTVNNLTNEDVVVKLKIPWEDAHYVTAPAGTEVSELLDEGTYIVKYSVCGTDYHFQLLIDDKYTLTLYPCKTQPTKIQVKSHLSEKVVLKLYGYEDYEVDIKPGMKTKVELFSGNIDYEYVACGGQEFFGELMVAKNGTTQLVLHSCEWYLDPARIYGQPNLVKFKIVNQASFPVILTLIGPSNYLVTVEPGINVFTMVSGSYKYSYYQDNQPVTGSMVVTQNGLGVLVITPSYVIGYVDETANQE